MRVLGLLALVALGIPQQAVGELEPWLGTRGKEVFFDDFSDLATVPEHWFFREHWTVAEDALVRTAAKGKNQRVFIKEPFYGDCIIEVDFAFRGAKEIRVLTGTPGKYNAVVILWPNGFRLTSAKDKSVKPVLFNTIHGECRFAFKPETVYRLMLEIHGEDMVARIDDEHFIVGRHPILARQRDYFALQVDEPSAAFGSVRITGIAGKSESWPKKREDLEPVQATRPWLPCDPDEQRRIRETVARDWLNRNDADFPRVVMAIDTLKAFAAKQYPDAFSTVKERRKKIEEERKRLLLEDEQFKALRDGINKLKRKEIEILHLLHAGLADLPKARYDYALALAREASKEVAAFRVVEGNRRLLEVKMERLYPQLQRSNEDLLEEGRVAREKVAKEQGYIALTQRIAGEVRKEKDLVGTKAAELLIRFE